MLIAYFDDKQLLKYYKSAKSDYIKLESFIEYMIYANRSDNTKGLYHVYMPYIHAFYNLPTSRSGFVNYSIINQKIIPSRIEYSILYAIQYFIDNDEYLKNKCKLEYQFKLDQKYFDACIPELKILIEIQEDKENHNDKKSDNHKRLIAKFNEYYIIYFHESDLKKDEMSVRNFFNNKLKCIIYGALSFYKKEETLSIIRELYVEKLNEDIREIKSSGFSNKKEKIKIIQESIQYFSDASPLKNILQLYINNEKVSGNKYFLSLEDIYEVYPRLKKDEDFQKDCTNNLRYNNICKNGTYYYEWSFLQYVIIEYSGSKNESADYLKFLTELDGLYKKLLLYNNEYLHECKIKKEECDEYYSKLENDELVYYKNELQVQSKRLDLVENANRIILEKFKLPSFIENLKRILESPFKKTSKAALASISTSLTPIKETINLTNDVSTVSLVTQKIIGKSILKDIPTFPYVYDPDSTGVTYKELYLTMKSFLMKDIDIYTITKQFCLFFNSEKTEIIYNISHIEIYNKFSIEIIENLLEQVNITVERETTEAGTDSESLGDLEEA
jgi:hypothetical protein